jgi:light-regulated signal transduction histidine kinase (bacteriophytochrome)
MPPSKPEPSAPHTDSELSEFLSRACHDLRGPLRAMRSHAELVLKHGAAPPGSDLERSLGFIVDGSVQAAALVDGLTDYSLALQIDPGTFQSVPLEVILRAALAKLAGYLRENHAEVSYEKLPVLQGNADRLMQLFEQLVDHSVRHRGPDEPRVRITAESRSEDWLFRVRNNGPGIEAEFLEKIFKPFARFHGRERPGPGLATCRAIVERHGGAMWAESAPGEGTTFCFTLPAEGA